MNLFLTFLLVPGALALIWFLAHLLTGGILPDRDADLAFLRSYGDRTEADR